jgi:hypothetical protein
MCQFYIDHTQFNVTIFFYTLSLHSSTWHFIKRKWLFHNATSIAKRVVAKDNNKLTGLQFRMAKLDSRETPRGEVISASGN